MAQHPFTTGRWLEANHLQENENWQIARNKKNEVTSFCYVPNKDIKSIFLGTFPIYEISENNTIGIHPEFFYGSNVNSFWPTLGSIFQQPTNDVQNYIELLNNLKIGIADILLKTDRNPLTSSSDKDLYPVKYNNIYELLEKYPSIKNIFVTSGSREGIGLYNNSKKNATTWLKNSLRDVNEIIPRGFNLCGYKKTITVNNRVFNLIYLHSPSRQGGFSINKILKEEIDFDLPDLNVNSFRLYQWEYFIKKYHLKQETNTPQALINFFEQ